MRHESDMLGHEARGPRAPKKNDSQHECEASHAPCLTGRRPVAFSSTGVVPLINTGKTFRYSRALNASRSCADDTGPCIQRRQLEVPVTTALTPVQVCGYRSLLLWSLIVPLAHRVSACPDFTTWWHPETLFLITARSF